MQQKWKITKHQMICFEVTFFFLWCENKLQQSFLFTSTLLKLWERNVQRIISRFFFYYSLKRIRIKRFVAKVKKVLMYGIGDWEGEKEQEQERLFSLLLKLFPHLFCENACEEERKNSLIWEKERKLKKSEIVKKRKEKKRNQDLCGNF